MPTLDDKELFERFSSRVPQTAVLLGMEMLSVDSAAGIVRMAFTVKPEFCNPAGNLQGGFCAAMMDDAAATAIIARSGGRFFIPTLEFKVSFFAAARAGQRVICEGRCLKHGRTISFAEVDMRDEAGKLLARMTTTTMPIPFPQSPHLVDPAP